MTQATTMDDIVLSGINPAIYTEDDFREIARMVRSEEKNPDRAVFMAAILTQISGSA